MLAERWKKWLERRAMRRFDAACNGYMPPPARMLPRKGQWQCFGFCLGAFAAVAVAPGSGPLVRQQLRLALPTRRIQAVMLLQSTRRGFVEDSQIPASQNKPVPPLADDVGAQVAWACLDDEGDHAEQYNNYSLAKQAALTQHSLNTLTEVARQFPNDPLPRAAFLIAASRIQIRPKWEEAYLVDGKITLPNGQRALVKFHLDSTKLELLRECENMAREGERLEPDNAFFAIMQATVHLKAGREQAALQDLDRASRKPHWKDHNGTILQGIWRLNAAKLGFDNSILRATMLSTGLMRYYEPYSHTARRLLLQAWKQERAGNVEAGIAIRGRVMRVGALMRDQANRTVIADSGEAALLFACDQPESTQDKYIEPVIKVKQIAWYIGYLRAHHHPEEAQWVQRQTGLHTSARPSTSYFDASSAIEGVEWYWMVGLCSLAALTLTLVIGGVVGGVNYRRRFSMNRARALVRPAVWGIGLALAMVFCALALLTLGLVQNVSSAMDALGFLELIGIAALVGGMARGARVMATTAVLTLLAACSMTVLVFVQTGSALLTAHWLMKASSLENVIIGFTVRIAISYACLLTLCVLALPMLFGLWMAGRSRLRRVPIAWGTWRGLSTSLLPAASLLLLGYAGLSLMTARAEASANILLLQALDNEKQVARDAQREARENANY